MKPQRPWNRLGGIHQRTVTVNTGVHPTMFLVPAVFHPERQNIFCQITHKAIAPCGEHFLYIVSHYDYFCNLGLLLLMRLLLAG